jgi:hypothetical protein
MVSWSMKPRLELRSHPYAEVRVTIYKGTKIRTGKGYSLRYGLKSYEDFTRWIVIVMGTDVDRFCLGFYDSDLSILVTG